LGVQVLDKSRGANGGDGGEGEAHNAISRVRGEGGRLGGHRGEVLASDAESSNGDGVTVDGARGGRAIAVRDAKGATLLRGSGRLGSAVLAVRGATRGRAAGGRDPEICRASVKVDQERLGGGANADGTSPEFILVLIDESLLLALGELVERLDAGEEVYAGLGLVSSVAVGVFHLSTGNLASKSRGNDDPILGERSSTFVQRDSDRLGRRGRSSGDRAGNSEGSKSDRGNHRWSRRVG